MEHVALEWRLQLCCSKFQRQKSTRDRAVIFQNLERDPVAVVVALCPSVRRAHSVNDVLTVFSIKLKNYRDSKIIGR
eukprot:COSAG02_NODE_2314_length_9156_cov_8.075072_4_plen_77_part_00